MSIKSKYKANLVGNWLRDGSLADWSGNGNSATLSSGTSYWLRTNRGRVPNIDGATTEIIVPTSTDYEVTEVDFSVSCWVFLRRTNAFSMIMGRMSTNNGWRLYEVGGVMGFGVGDGATVAVSGTSTYNEWVHMVGTYRYDATEGNTLISCYLNGVSVGTPAPNNYVEDAGQPIGLGVENNGGNAWIDGYIQDCIIWNGVELSASEVADLYTESLQEPRYDYTAQETTLPAGDFSDSTLIAGWDMVNRDGTIIDCTGGGDDGTVTLPATQTEGMLGKGMMFYNAAGGKVTVASGGGVDNMWDSGATFMGWVNLKSDGGAAVGRIADKSRSLIIASSLSGGFLKFRFRHDFSGTNADYITTNTVFPINNPTHLAVKYTATAGEVPTFYVNGKVIDAGDVTNLNVTPSTGTRNTDAGSDLILGSDSSESATLDGWLSDMRYYSGEMTDTQIATEYSKAKGKLNYYADGRDWNESFANESTGELSNTGWVLNGVNTKVVDNGLADGTKSIVAAASGVQGSLASEQAFGTWEFDIMNSSGVYQNILIVAQTKFGGVSAGNAGYNLSFRDDGSMRLRAVNNAGAISSIVDTTTTTFAFDVFHSIKITRNGQSWELFVNGVSMGTGIETTTITSIWTTIDLDNNGEIRNFKFSPVIQ